MSHDNEVYILDEGVRGTIVTLLAYGAIVKYNIGGIEYKVFMTDEDYVFVDQEEDE